MYAYGDSFTRGDNLENEEEYAPSLRRFVQKPNTYHVNRKNNWPSLLANKLQIGVNYNKGSSGACPLEIAMTAIRDHTQHDSNTLIIVGLTAPDRLPMPSNSQSIFETSSKGYWKLLERYARGYKELNMGYEGSILDDDVLRKYYLSFYNIFQLHQLATNATIIFVNLWYDFEDDFWTQISHLGTHLPTIGYNKDNSQYNSCRTFIENKYSDSYPNPKEELYLPCGHFNEVMCRITADEIYHLLKKEPKVAQRLR